MISENVPLFQDIKISLVLLITAWKMHALFRENRYLEVSTTANNLIRVLILSTLRAESPSIFLDKSGRGRRLCERLQDSLIRRSSEKMDESVQFPVGETGFLLTRMIIPMFLSEFSTAIRMHKCRDHANCTRGNKLSLGATD